MRSPTIRTSASPDPMRARRTTRPVTRDYLAAGFAGGRTGPSRPLRIRPGYAPLVLDPLNVEEAVDLLDRVRSGLAGDEFGVAVGRPVLLVELDQPVTGDELQPPVGWPCVLVATSTAPYAPEAPVGPDVLISAGVDPPRPWVGASGRASEATWAVEEAVLRHPQAATALVQVIRLGATLSPASALVVESLAYSTLQSGPEHGEWLATRPSRPPDSRTDPVVQLDRDADALWITLDRPERRNAYSARMRDELVAALELAANDPSVATIHLRGNGPNFSSGGDLAEFGTRPDPATAHGIRVQRSAGWWISLLRSRVTAHLHGACVGAGIELSAFAGTVEAAEDTTVSLPEVSMGLIPGAGGTASIPRRIGPQRAAWLALTGTRLEAAIAAQWGLIDRMGCAPYGREPGGS
jgi:enoyl-CoA hydratase/carnithine racemase